MNLYFSADDEKFVELDCVSSCGSLVICSSLHVAVLEVSLCLLSFFVVVKNSMLTSLPSASAS